MNQNQKIEKKNFLLIGHRYHLGRFQKGFYDALARQFNLTTIFVENDWISKISDIKDYKNQHVCMWYVRFRELIHKPAFKWEDFPGVRLMYDEDAHANYHRMIEVQFAGKWPEVFKKNGFHVLLTTGRNTRDALIADGVDAFWLPKAYDPLRLFEMELERKGICYYGNRYCSRRAMLHYLDTKNIDCEVFKCEHYDLNKYLNKYLGTLICNMEGTRRSGLYRLIHHYYPSRGLKIEPGFEPMLKNFEVAGAGCAPIADWIDELAEMGFEDGNTIVSYRTFEELVDKLQYYLKELDKLREIGKKAGKLALKRHTWGHRAIQLDDYLSTL